VSNAENAVAAALQAAQSNTLSNGAKPAKQLGGFNGKGWKPGQSGNPGGRRPLTALERTIRRDFKNIISARDIETAIQLVVPPAVMALARACERGESWAVTLALAYGWGRPLERTEHTGDPTQQHKVVTFQILR
jgi:hypothetical protein